MKCAECVTGSNTMTNCFRQLQRHHRLLARRQFDRLERHFVPQARECLLVDVDSRAPENLPEIFPERQRIGIVRRDPPDARADGEGDLDLFVDGGLVAGRAQRAIIVVMAQRFQRGMRVEHAAAAGAEHVPAQIEQPEPRCMQEAGNHLLLVEAGLRRKIQQVDPVELAILAVLDQMLDGVGDRGIGGLLQDCKQRLRFAHVAV